MPPPDADAPGMDPYDDAPCGLLLTRRDGLIERVNCTFCGWARREPHELVGRLRFQDLLTVGGRIFQQTHIQPLLQMQGSVSEVKLDLQVAGATLPIMVNAVRHERDGEVTHALAVFVAQERHAYERELMHSRRHAESLVKQQEHIQSELRDADRRKDEFLAMLAHELRNPLAPIATSAQLLKLTPDDPVRVRRIGEVIERQIGHLTNLVDDLMDVSRVTRGLIELDVRPIELAGVVAAAVEQSRPIVEAHGHALHVDTQAGGVIEGDRTRLVQVVVNLLNNAAKYTPQGGHITVTLGRDGGQARVDVVDDGVGIGAELLPHIFDLFSQAHRTPDRSQGGLGIGLALVRSLVGLHHGTVEVQSEGPDRGSRFTLRFPLSRKLEPKADRALAPPTQGDPARVLIVDDNRDAALMLADVMRFAGHDVDVATSAQDALDRLSRGMEQPTVCILDIGLPDICGYELAVRIRRLMRDRPPMFVALTGYGQPHDRVLSSAAGFDHHFVKPANTGALLDLVSLSTAGRDVGVGEAGS